MALTIPNWKNQSDVLEVLENVESGDMYDDNEMRTLIENIREFFQQEGDIMEPETFNMTLDELEAEYGTIPDKDGDYWSNDNVRLLYFYVYWQKEGFYDDEYMNEPSYLHPNDN
jgi:hypothetical protein